MTSGTLTRGRLSDHPVWRRALASDDITARLVLPVIVSGAVEDRERVEGSGGLSRMSITETVREARTAAAAGIAGLLLFGVSDRKDETAVLASERDHVLPRAIRAVKDAVPDMAVATDVCVCAYTAHGQCVLFSGGSADIGATLERLAEIARVHAEAGADLLIPSGMLDGAVAAIRGALAASHSDLPIAAMAKLESALYRAHRTAVGGVPVSDRAVPLLDPTDRSAAQARVARDVAHGADAVVVKPGIAALDVLSAVAATVDRPVISYHTADEHALFVAETDVDGPAAEREMIAASRRAGADLVITCGALSGT